MLALGGLGGVGLARGGLAGGGGLGGLAGGLAGRLAGRLGWGSLARYRLRSLVRLGMRVARMAVALTRLARMTGLAVITRLAVALTRLAVAVAGLAVSSMTMGLAWLARVAGMVLTGMARLTRLTRIAGLTRVSSQSRVSRLTRVASLSTPFHLFFSNAPGVLPPQILQRQLRRAAGRAPRRRLARGRQQLALQRAIGPVARPAQHPALVLAAA